TRKPEREDVPQVTSGDTGGIGVQHGGSAAFFCRARYVAIPCCNEIPEILETHGFVEYTCLNLSLKHDAPNGSIGATYGATVSCFCSLPGVICWFDTSRRRWESVGR